MWELTKYNGIDHPDPYEPVQAASRGERKGWNILRWNWDTGLFHGYSTRYGEFTVPHETVWAKYLEYLNGNWINFSNSKRDQQIRNHLSRQHAFNCGTYSSQMGQDGVERYPNDPYMPQLLDLSLGRFEFRPPVCPICEKPVQWTTVNVERLGTSFHADCWANRPKPTVVAEYSWTVCVYASYLTDDDRAEIERQLRRVAHGKIETMFRGEPGNIVADIHDEGVARLLGARVGSYARTDVQRSWRPLEDAERAQEAA